MVVFALVTKFIHDFECPMCHGDFVMEYHRRKRCPEGNTHLQLRLRNKFNGIWPIVMLLRKARKQVELYAIVIAFFILQIDLQSFV